METELDQLIELYEKEKQFLLNNLDECLKETDYLGAHYYQSAVNRVDVQLKVFYKLKDPFFEQKQHLEWVIKLQETDFEGVSDTKKKDLQFF